MIIKIAEIKITLDYLLSKAFKVFNLTLKYFVFYIKLYTGFSLRITFIFF